MARKVLISFLGTGPLASKKERIYKTARYHIGETDLGEYSFVSAALEKHYNVDATILVGTVHSMWEEVYQWHKKDKGQSLDDDVYLEIADYCEKANYQTDLSIPHQEDIETTLGTGSKVVLVKYGITEDEVKENINTILGIERFLNKKDELIVDVTHSFRSLPIFITNLLVYLQNVSEKKITISHIHYGMLEMRDELGFAPIIDLKAVLGVNDWITGAYSFSQFGNAYMISELIAKENKSASTLLKEFSNLMNLNHLYAIKNVSQRLSSIKNASYNTLIPNLIVTPIVDEFIRRFRIGVKEKDAVFQLKVARWQLDHRKYAQAFLTLNEAIITHVCETNRIDAQDYDCREAAKDRLNGRRTDQLTCDQCLKTLYRQIKKLRNATAHALETEANADNMIATLKNTTNQLEQIIQ